MLSTIWDLWDRAYPYFKQLPGWSAFEPYVAITAMWLAAQILTYQWLAESLTRPSIALFRSSYLSMRITIAALGVAAITLIMRRTGLRRDTQEGIAPFWHANPLTWRTIGITLVVALTTVGFRWVSPNRVSNITVRFLSLEPAVAPGALAYLIYELNRRQRNWYFRVDFREFTDEMLTTAEAERCSNDPHPRLCEADALAAGEPFIGITDQPLGGAYFAEHRNGVSVISTSDRDSYAPLSGYEFLAYTLVLQGLAIHLDLYGGGLPQEAFEQSRVSDGGLFQYIPDKQAVKSSILAARLSPEEEALLLNRFGSGYMTIAASLLAMDWLYSDRVRFNLEKVFGATLGR